MSMLHSYALCGNITVKETDRDLRYHENLLQEKNAKSEDEKRSCQNAERRRTYRPWILDFLGMGQSSRI